MLNVNRQLVSDLIRGLGFCLLVILGFCYSIFERGFAELHIQLSFLDFPIFVGEIFLGICLLLLIFFFITQPKIIHKWHSIIVIYLAWLLGKSFLGYFVDGPFAFRTAALFYYPLFSVIGYYSYDRRFFTTRSVAVMLVILIGVILIMKPIVVLSYYHFVYLILPFVLLLSLRSLGLKIILSLLILLLFPWDLYLGGARTRFIGFIISGIFIAAYISFSFLRIKKASSHFLFLGMVGFLFLFLMSQASSNKIKSLYKINKLSQIYQKQQRFIDEKEKDFIFREIPVKLYRKESDKITKEEFEDYVKRTTLRSLNYPDDYVVGLKSIKEEQKSETEKELENIIRDLFLLVKDKLSEAVSNQDDLKKESGLTPTQIRYKIEKDFEPEIQLVIEDVGKRLDQLVESEQSLSQEMPPSTETPPSPENDPESIDKEHIKKQVEIKLRSYMELYLNRDVTWNKPWPVEVDYGNILFRLFMWKDLIDELIKTQSWMGISFGKPFRSKSIEILSIAQGEWASVGWVDIHNSFLNTIYRSGIVGLILLVLLFGKIFLIIRKFITARSLKGILLCSILIDFLVYACFLSTLEMPYTSITFWSLLGMTLAYQKQLA